MNTPAIAPDVGACAAVHFWPRALSAAASPSALLGSVDLLDKDGGSHSSYNVSCALPPAPIPTPASEPPKPEPKEKPSLKTTVRDAEIEWLKKLKSKNTTEVTNSVRNLFKDCKPKYRKRNGTVLL